MGIGWHNGTFMWNVKFNAIQNKICVIVAMYVYFVYVKEDPICLTIKVKSQHFNIGIFKFIVPISDSCWLFLFAKLYMFQ